MNDFSLSLSQRLVSLGLSALVQATIILAAGLLAGRFAQKRGPAWQSLTYRAALATTAMAIIVTFFAGGHIPERVSFSHRVAPAVSRPDQFIKHYHPPITLEDVGGGKSAVPDAIPVASPHSYSPSERRWTPPSDWPWILAGALWLCGAILYGLRSIAGSVSLLRLRRTASEISEGPALEIVRQLSEQLKIAPPPLRIHAAVRGPFLAGLRHPAIYLPADYADQYDASTIRAVLSHELAHLVRKDCLWLMFQQFLCAVLWFHPLFHAASNRLTQAAEEACDAIVVSLDCPAQEYAASLLALAERSRNHREPAHALGVTPIRSSVGKRIRLILDRSRQAAIRVPRWGLALTGIAVVLLTTLALAVFCPDETGWRLAARASAMGVTPPMTWTPAPDYASHFRLAREHGWSMAPVRGVPLVDRPKGFETTLPPAIPDSDLALMRACRHDWISSWTSTDYLNPKTAPASLRGKIEKVLADHPRFYYAEYRLALWYACHRDLANYQIWRDRALEDAPAILAGRVQYDDGRPVAGMEYAPYFFYRSSDSSREDVDNSMPEDIAITDEDGCYYVPVYRALYDDEASTVDDVNDPVYKAAIKHNAMTRQYLHRIIADRHVGLMPPAYMRPFIKFTGVRGANESSWKKPVPITGTRLDVSWTAPHGADHYYIFFHEAVPTNGKLLNDRLDPLGDGSIGVTTTHANMTLDFLGHQPIFVSGRTYEMYIIAFKGQERLSDSQGFYFTPRTALAPMAVTGRNVEWAIPNTHVQSVTHENGRIVVKGLTRVAPESADEVVFRHLFESRLVQHDLPHRIHPKDAWTLQPADRPFTMEFEEQRKPAQ